jgi:homogentisate solanesyltransferase
VHIDRINKPYLPIAARELTIEGASAVVLGCLVTGCAIVKVQFSPLIFSLYALGMLLGTVYSVPPFTLKRFPLAAGAIIAVVRGFLLNFGVYYAAREALGVPFQWNSVVIFMSTFMTVFASIIAVTKDLSDIKGDRQYNMSTFASTYGVPTIAKTAVGVLCFAYGATIAIAIALASGAQACGFRLGPMVAGHAAFACYVLSGYRRLVKDDFTQDAVEQFYYTSIWNAFYLEYVLYPFI